MNRELKTLQIYQTLRASSLINLLFLVLPLSAWAQPAITAEREIVNLGEVAWQQPKNASFELKNSGTEAWHLTAVHASCGCTQVTWSKEDVPPGGSTRIEVTFDAKMLGSFQKEIEVYTSASAEPTYLTLQGRVVTTLTDYTDNFPIDLGNVRLNTNVIEFDDVNRGDHPEAILQVVNNSRESYKPELMHLPSYLSARYVPELLAGGRIGRIHLILNSEKLKDYGLTETTIYLARKLGDKVSADNEINVSAVLLPSFAKLSASALAAAPKMQLSQDSIDFSDIGKKKKLTKTILVQNTGLSDLQVSNVQVYGRSLTLSLSDRVIQPGKTAKLKVTLQQDLLRKMKHQPRILLITNDPAHPKTVINCHIKQPN